MKIVDLFAGTGAFSYGRNCVFSNDIEPKAKQIYDINHDTTMICDDIHNINKLPEHDVLCAGFPCQPFSIAGARKGFTDERSNVFWKVIELLRDSLPRFIILENVKNLRTHDNGNTYKIICQNLENLGYTISSQILDTCKITGIPQHRERIYIVGILSKAQFQFDFGQIPVLPITDFLEQGKVSNKYYYSTKNKMYPIIKETAKSHVNTGTVYQYRRTYLRENKSGVCPTLTANMGSGGHNVPIIKDDYGIRKLTPRECFNLQGFPSAYKFSEKMSNGALYKLAGNAITLPIANMIFNKLYPFF